MSRDLPISVTFDLPQGWTLVSPDAFGQPDAAYVAVRAQDANDPVATNIVVSGFLSPAAQTDVAELAAEYVATLKRDYAVTVLKEDLLTAGLPPQAAQLLQVDFPVGLDYVTVNQIHIISAYPSADDSETSAVVQLIMTCPTMCFRHAASEFQRFVATIAPTATP